MHRKKLLLNSSSYCFSACPNEIFIVDFISLLKKKLGAIIKPMFGLHVVKYLQQRHFFQYINYK
jgi:hypothetical protein